MRCLAVAVAMVLSCGVAFGQTSLPADASRAGVSASAPNQSKEADHDGGNASAYGAGFVAIGLGLGLVGILEKFGDPDIIVVNSTLQLSDGHYNATNYALMAVGAFVFANGLRIVAHESHPRVADHVRVYQHADVCGVLVCTRR